MVVGKLVEPENQALSRHFGTKSYKIVDSRVNVTLAVTKKGWSQVPGGFRSTSNRTTTIFRLAQTLTPYWSRGT